MAALYLPGASFLHRADALAKVAGLTLWFVVALLAGRFATLIGLLLLGLGLFAVTGTLSVAARFLRFIFLLVVMCGLIWSVFSRDAGLRDGVVVGLRLAVMLLLGLCLLATTRIEDLSAALCRVGVPFRAAFALTLAFRLVPLFGEALDSVATAQRCRGLDPAEGGIITRIRRHVPLLVPLVLSSLRSADRLAVALESRGLGMLEDGRRTSILESRFGVLEGLLVGISTAAAAAATWLSLAGPGI